MPDRGEAGLDHDILILAADRWRARRQLDRWKIEQHRLAVAVLATETLVEGDLRVIEDYELSFLIFGRDAVPDGTPFRHTG